MIILVNIILYFNVIIFKLYCQNTDSLRRRNSLKNSDSDAASNLEHTYENVKFRFPKGRSSLRGHSRKLSDETRSLLENVGNPNSPVNKKINAKSYNRNVESFAKFDEIVNSKSGSVEVISDKMASGDFDKKKKPLSKSFSVKTHSNSNRLSWNRRHSLTHASSNSLASESTPEFKGFNIQPFLGHYCISNNIWRKVWGCCDYKCFSRDYFLELRFRLFQEINEYRQIHKVKPLYKDIGLYQKALFHAKRLAEEKALRRDYDTKYGEALGIIYYPAASVMVKKWYDEGSNYNYFSNGPKPGSQMFTQLVWKRTTHVGIGIAVRGNYIWVVAKFFPKGNLNGKYRSNINRPHFKCP